MMPRRPASRRAERARTTTGPAAPPGERPRPRPQHDPDPGFVAVGRALAPFGLKGELKVQPLTDNPARFRRGARLRAGAADVTVATVREAQGYFYVSFRGHGDRARAEPFRHALLQVREDDVAPLPEGQHYRFQLLGLTVVDTAGTPLGVLDEVIETGANDVYRVRSPAGDDLLLPATAGTVVSVDLDARRVVVDPPPWT